MLESLEEVILVDPDDREIGRAEKLRAHKLGCLHRAISVCVVDAQGRMLLQRRAGAKYHSPGLWTNTCCTHPRPGEPVQRAAERRLREEMGVSCPLKWTLRTQYTARVSPDLVENEVVHLFVGFYSGTVNPDREEVDEYMWQSHEDLLANIRFDPGSFTYWFKYYVSTFGEEIFQRAPH